MGSVTRAWIVATSIGAVEALKDQGVCRWNYAMRNLHQYAKKNLGASFSQESKRTSLLSSSSLISRKLEDGDAAEKLRRSEESLRTVMYLSCWGPNN
ncbi:hypothetical protein Syun_010455 [Stephania yunnanensis]|uniref:Wound-responsive family protein n=1 Tax=Stephania yunnanensis TaxID=152371 RepID=A0AAP0KJ49_9MAGN